MAKSPVPKASRLVPAANLVAWLGALAAGNRVWAPVTVDGRALFTELAAGREGEVDLEAVRAVNSPKGAVLPQTEPLVAYGRSKDPETGAVSMSAKPVGSCDPVVLFGMRPCDAAALTLMDKVFLTGDFVDDHYKARRERTTVIAVACPAPDKACFCTSFGLCPGSTEGADIVLFGRSGPGRKVETDAYFAVAYTDRGEALLGDPTAKAAGLTEVAAADGEALEKAVVAFQSLATPLGDRLGKVDVAEKLDGLFESPYWEKVSARCLGCGACTFICPTCYCFGVADAGSVSRGVRFRYWDSCKFPEFLVMAGGHDPRPAKKNRTRQRFMHKLNYYHHRYGDYLCVGCGRCVDSCPVGLHLPLVADEVRGL
jgi:ferredoxin